MSTTPDIDAAFFESAVGSTNVARYFDEDGSGNADATRVQEYLAMATRRVRDKLAASFPDAVLDAISVNENYKRTVAFIALSMRVQTRPEWMMGDGLFPYERQARALEEELTKIAKGLERLSTEESTTPNPMLSTRSPRTGGAKEAPIFAASKQFPSGRGGF